jgi:hypothetical protein
MALIIEPRLILFVCTALLLWGSAEQSLFTASVESTAIRGSTIEMTVRDGTRMTSDQLVGGVITVRRGHSTARMRIDAVFDGRGEPSLRRHLISVQQADGRWTPLCSPASDNSRWAFPLSGQSLPDGTLAVTSKNSFEIACSSGAQGKCLRLGYLPWMTLPRGLSALRAFNACVRMVRADYAGGGVAMTHDGFLIGVSDVVGVNPAKRTMLSFEAGWDENGAVCIRHLRVKDLATPRQIAASSIRLTGRIGRDCTPEKAIALGAILLSTSAS